MIIFPSSPCLWNSVGSVTSSGLSQTQGVSLGPGRLELSRGSERPEAGPYPMDLSRENGVDEHLPWAVIESIWGEGGAPGWL